jgi:hypothetical protein
MGAISLFDRFEVFEKLPKELQSMICRAYESPRKVWLYQSREGAYYKQAYIPTAYRLSTKSQEGAFADRCFKLKLRGHDRSAVVFNLKREIVVIGYITTVMTWTFPVAPRVSRDFKLHS